MPPTTKNLGLVKAIHEGVNPPTNTVMIWYDTNPGQNMHKYYDTVAGAWKALRAYEYTPTGTADTYGSQGDIAYDDNFIYVKTSIGWQQSALTTF